MRQKCYFAKNPAFPDWRVYFRVDADATGKRITVAGTREEIIVEYGRSSTGATRTPISSPYTATITKQGVRVATYTMPKHWWYARWRYQSSPRPVVRSPAMLKARGLAAAISAQRDLFGLQPEHHRRSGWTVR